MLPFALLASLISLSNAATLYLVGDSTMAVQTAASGIQGWGVPASQYFQNLTIVNRAVSGRSARSYTREGKWTAVQALLVAGDYVVIEFGHNDGGSPATSDRASVVGEGSETQTVTLADGTVEVVRTFPTYLKAMVDGALSKGATPILSSQTPNNPYEGVDTINFTPSRFVTYARNAAVAKNVPYVDHFTATLLLDQKLGKATVESYFPIDHTHTNPTGANQVAYAFMSGLKCPLAKSVLKAFVNAAGNTAGPRCPA
ncbi:putative rhamnogalacturonan acetyl esterase [Mycena rebaudengoi]|nr:putative rhamnogalacturonan acetyl esterase [Mycena rebaudengoi]